MNTDWTRIGKPGEASTGASALRPGDGPTWARTRCGWLRDYATPELIHYLRLRVCHNADMIRFVSLFALVVSAGIAAAPDGQALFEKNCAICHKETADNRTPRPEALKRMPNAAIVNALEAGSMKAQGAALSAVERQSIADFLAPRVVTSAEPAKANNCEAGAPALTNVNGWNGWSTDLVNSRMQSVKEGGIRGEDVPKLKVKW